ncbi:hypothetical protein D3C87_1630860 [compost metagenome]
MTVLPSSFSRPIASSAVIDSAPAGSSTTPSTFSMSMIVMQIAFSGSSMTWSAEKRRRAAKFRSPIRPTAAPSTKLSTWSSVTRLPVSRLCLRLGAPEGSQKTKWSAATSSLR